MNNLHDIFLFTPLKSPLKEGVVVRNFLNTFLKFSKFFNQDCARDFSIISTNSVHENISVGANLKIESFNFSLMDEFSEDSLLDSLDHNLRKIYLHLIPIDQKVKHLSEKQKFYLSLLKSILSNKRNIIFHHHNIKFKETELTMIKNVLKKEFHTQKKNIFIFSPESIMWMDIASKIIQFDHGQFQLRNNKYNQLNQKSEKEKPKLKIA